MTASSRSAILTHLQLVCEWQSSSEIADALGATRPHVSAQLHHMCAAKKVQRINHNRCFLYRAAGAKTEEKES